MTEYERKRRERERVNNARRLAVALWQRKDDPQFIDRIASLLHYLPDQLRTDIADLDEYTQEKAAADREADTDD